MAPDLEYEERSPPPELVGVVRCVWQLRGVSTDLAGRQVAPIVPDGCPEVVLNLSDPFGQLDDAGRWALQPRCMLVGQLTSPALVAPSGTTRIVGIRFTPWGAARWIRMPMSELRDAFVPLDAIDQHGMESLADRLSSRPVPDWSDVVFDFLLASIRFSTVDPVLSVRVVAAIQEAGGRITVRGLAKRLHVGERQLERVMRRDVGLPPIVLGRIIRMQGALRAMLHGSLRTLSEVAVEAGYSDQSHFVREFRRLVGYTPSQFLNGDFGLTEHFVSTSHRP